ncbi:unnamed protein product [Brassica oleracea]
MENQSAISRIWDYYPKHELEVVVAMKTILVDEKMSIEFPQFRFFKKRLEVKALSTTIEWLILRKTK